VKNGRKPEWLQKKVNPADQAHMQRLLEELRLNTVCRQALCPNISECFSCGQATFLIMGKICTRHCSFCNVGKGAPLAVDRDEPARIAEAVVRLGLSHVVITSPTRDDLPDGGASLYVSSVEILRSRAPHTRIELLIPDFMGDQRSLAMVADTGPDIIAHNIETVPRLYHIRSGAEYVRSLEVLRYCGSRNPVLRIKSGVMLGMGEGEAELVQVFKDLLDVGCEYLIIGQYLAPSRRHFPVQEYVPPERFELLRSVALDLGFSHVESGPYVRSSYHAALYI
jgi:lipoic acid synthetase